MGDKTGIEWTDATWNPTVGCSDVSPGCDNCYAIKQAHRNTAMGSPAYVPALTVSMFSVPRWTGEVRTVPDRIGQPRKWRKPRKIFVDSMSDLFHVDVPVEFIADVWETMAACPQHIFQVLTKRPQRMQEILSEFGDPLPNVWLGVSIESDSYTFRADYLRDTPAAVRWISAEPLLGRLASLSLVGIDWLVIGGESGGKARPMHPDWVGELIDRCFTPVQSCPRCGGSGSIPVDEPDGAGGRALGGRACECQYEGKTAVLFKQWGQWAPNDWELRSHRQQVVVSLDGTATPASDRPLPWADTDRVMRRHYSKKEAGRVYDGGVYDEYPEVGTT